MEKTESFLKVRKYQHWNTAPINIDHPQIFSSRAIYRLAIIQNPFYTYREKGKGVFDLWIFEKLHVTEFKSYVSRNI